MSHSPDRQILCSVDISHEAFLETLLGAIALDYVHSKQSSAEYAQNKAIACSLKQQLQAAAVTASAVEEEDSLHSLRLE